MSRSPLQFDFLGQSFRHRADQLRSAAQQADRGPGQVPVVPITAPREWDRPANRPARNPFEESADPGLTRSITVVIGQREFRIRGNVVSCACPDCQAPMSVRVWLGLAECWRCQCSIELDRGELQALQGEVARQSGVPIPAPAVPPRKARQPADWNAVVVPPAGTAGLPPVLELEGTSAKLRDGLFLGWLPPWLVSFLLHVILIVMLALIMFSPDPDYGKTPGGPIEFVLSPFISELHREGGTVNIQAMATDADVQPVQKPNPADEAAPDQTALEDARELQNDPLPLTDLPDLKTVREAVSQGGGSRAALAARDPRLREEIVYREGGTSATEAAVARGLRWLASVQNRDGSWSLSGYSRHASPANRGDAAGTGLALLPFLGAGQTQEFGIYKEVVASGLQWIIDHQKPDGDLRAGFPGQAGMYAHGQCAIVLCEAYALTGDERLREPAQRAIDFIVEAQHREGGWRYFPGQEGDTSVFGWQLMALQSAREIPSLVVPSSALSKAEQYLARAGRVARGDPVAEPGVLYRYQPGDGDVSASMTAEAMLCRMYLGWKRDDPRMMRAVRWMLREHPPSSDRGNLYYWYYATQVLHHFGGVEWSEWNRQLRELLVDSQIDRGQYAGSWDHRDFEWGEQGGRIFVTSFAVCTLEVYYRRLPLFRNLDLEPLPDDGSH